MTWKSVLAVIVGACVVAAIDGLVGLSRAGLLALAAVLLVIIGVTTLPDAGGLREPRKD